MKATRCVASDTMASESPKIYPRYNKDAFAGYSISRRVKCQESTPMLFQDQPALRACPSCGHRVLRAVASCPECGGGFTANALAASRLEKRAGLARVALVAVLVVLLAEVVFDGAFRLTAGIGYGWWPAWEVVALVTQGLHALTLLLILTVAVIRVPQKSTTPHLGRRVLRLYSAHAIAALLVCSTTFRVIEARVNPGSGREEQVIFGLAFQGDAEGVARRLSNGDNKHSVYRGDRVRWWGATPLTIAAAKGHEGVVRVLIESGANPNIQDRHGWTPLMWASLMCSPDTVAALLMSGADPAIQDKEGLTAAGVVAAAYDESDRKQALLDLLEPEAVAPEVGAEAGDSE